MATYGRTMRRGLPRQSGGEPWPPAGAVLIEQADDAGREPGSDAVASSSDSAGTTTAPPPAHTTPPAVPAATAEPPGEAAAAPALGTSTAARTPVRSLRRGLPRVPGGEPWPPSDNQPVVASAPEGKHLEGVETAPPPSVVPEHSSAKPIVPAPAEDGAAQAETAGTGPTAIPDGSTLLRRGLPRVPGGDPWPPETAVAVEPVALRERAAPAAREEVETPEAQQQVSVPAAAQVEPAPVTTPPPAKMPSSSAKAAPTRAPSGAARAPLPQRPAGREPEAKKPRSRAINLLLGALGLLGVALAAVFFTRWLVTLSFMQDFLTTYPGETALPAGTDPGFPAWAQWQHFFNFFLIVLIIRSGLQVRSETRPPGFWTPKWSKGSDGKISLTLWFHQTLDVLWLLNGLVFVVLLFVTGHWARLVPTTWEVIPNALSALIQYVSLDWPTENGWANYNSLQMLAYFVTVFIAAPLATISGARMSGMWPKDARKLNRVYPVEWARAIHFPVMLYFVAFIIGHVALVFATGALRNLNHMYGGQDTVNWTGFWIFFGSLLLVVGAWIAARPVVLAPIAGLLGRVSSR